MKRDTRLGLLFLGAVVALVIFIAAAIVASRPSEESKRRFADEILRSHGYDPDAIRSGRPASPPESFDDTSVMDKRRKQRMRVFLDEVLKEVDEQLQREGVRHVN